VSAPAHLVNAARVLEQILSELHPDRQWIVSVREDDRFDGDVTVNGDRRNVCSVADNAHAIGDGSNPSTAPRSLDEDALDQAA
jgi:hypothetical protein